MRLPAGGRKNKTKQKPAEGRRVSGNPAKAAQQAKDAQDKAAANPAANPFGSPDGEEVNGHQGRLGPLNLPKDFSKYLN